MEEKWLFSATTLFNTETLRLDGQNKVTREIGAIIE